MGTILFFGPFHTELQKCFQVFKPRGFEVFWEKQEKRFIDLLKHRQPSLVLAESRAHGTVCRSLTDAVITHSPHTKVIILTEDGLCPHGYQWGPRSGSVCQAHHTAQKNLLLTAENLLFGEALSPSDLQGLGVGAAEPRRRRR